jgi:hypothetical protein
MFLLEYEYNLVDEQERQVQELPDVIGESKRLYL